MSDAFMVLDRFTPNDGLVYNDIPPEDRLLGLFIDCETTGLDPEVDKIIQLSIVPFTFDRTGRMGMVERANTFLEDPGVPLSDEIKRLTGLTDEQLHGQKFDDARILTIAVDAAIVICHNAEFDRQFLEKRFPFFEGLRFGCSYRDVPWAEAGYTTAKLEWLMFKHLKMFYDGHKAEIDCYAGTHLLSQPVFPATTHSGLKPALAYVLDAARSGWTRLYGCNTPYDLRHVLKARHYHWNDGSNAEPKSWWKDVPTSQVGEEAAWLRNSIGGYIEHTSFDSRKRFSARIGR